MGIKDRRRIYETLFEGAPDAIFVEDATGKVLDCNPAAAALHGMTRQEIIGRNATELVPPQHRHRTIALQANPPREFEAFSLTADGRSIPVAVRTSRIDYLGQPALLLHVRDISEYKRSERELQGANDELEFRVQSRTAELERANEVLREEIAERNRAEEARERLERQVQGALKMEAVGRLAGGVAHDFNNLLTVITGKCERQLGKLEEGDPIRAELLVIYEAAHKAAKVTRQLLAFGRKQVLQAKTLNLNTVIGGMETMLHSLVRDNIEMTTDFSNDLWSIEADPGQIEQVLMNLVVNAIDAMPDGGKLLISTSNVELDESPTGFGFNVSSGPYVMLSVKDTGIGMDADVLKHIFEPFFTTKEKMSGSGLGLPTVYGIIKQSGGYITAKSKPGDGSSFNVYLPGILAAAVETRKEHVVAVSAPGTETILVAEDSDLVRQLTREMLEVRGYRVLEATNGQHALSICKSYDGPIHLTLSDVIMPGMTGRELADQVTEVRPQMKVLLMSGYADEITRTGFLRRGLHFIEKPFTSNSLALKIREMLDQTES